MVLQNQNQQRVRRRLPVGSNSKFHEIVVLLDGDRGIVELEVNGINVSFSYRTNAFVRS